MAIYNREEDRIQRSIVSFFDLALSSEETYWCAIPNGEKRDKVTGAILKGLGVRAGAPDIVMCHRGRFIALEVKKPDPKSRQSPAQIEAENSIMLAGGIYRVVRSLDEVIALLDVLQVPMRGRPT